MGEILRAGLAELRATRTSMKWSAFPPDVIPAFWKPPKVNQQ